MSRDVAIRHLRTYAELEACVALQRETWGPHFTDAVPASILLVSQKLGGVVAGAFAGAGELVGFVFGITGVENGAVVHWSDMLAVRERLRGVGIGRRLKEFQRRTVAQIGGRVIYWTFDPLVSRNAHLNFNVFGVRAHRYERDMYGSNTGSELHRGVGTDRLIVAWPVADDELALQRSRAAAARARKQYETSPVTGDPDAPTPPPVGALAEGDLLRIVVPRDLASIQDRDAALAARWRQSTRSAFEAAFAAGYAIEGFTSEPRSDRGFYLLVRGATPADPAGRETRAAEHGRR